MGKIDYSFNARFKMLQDHHFYIVIKNFEILGPEVWLAGCRALPCDEVTRVILLLISDLDLLFSENTLASTTMPVSSSVFFSPSSTIGIAAAPRFADRILATGSGFLSVFFNA